MDRQEQCKEIKNIIEEMGKILDKNPPIMGFTALTCLIVTGIQMGTTASKEVFLSQMSSAWDTAKEAGL
jgi:hypothetical protein